MSEASGCSNPAYFDKKLAGKEKISSVSHPKMKAMRRAMSENFESQASFAQRQLAAIFIADVVGYSSLMSVDEEGTYHKLKSDLKDVISPLIALHGGRLINKIGDGFLAIFPSVVGAVDCASKMQGGKIADATGTKGQLELIYRIGINIGDIIVEDEDVYGNDVNVAARLEALSPPGGFALSGLAYEQVKRRSSLIFEKLGFFSLKNISDPMEVYQVVKPVWIDRRAEFKVVNGID